MGALTRLQEIYLDTLRGGMTVNTPPSPAAPILRTVIQFDGDIQNMVCCDPDGALPEPAVLQALFMQHRAALQCRLDGFARWRKAVKYVGYLAMGGAAAGSLYSFMEMLRNQGFRLHFLLLLASLLLPACPRLLAPLLAPWAFRVGLQIAALGIARERHRQNATETERLKCLRKRRPG